MDNICSLTLAGANLRALRGSAMKNCKDAGFAIATNVVHRASGGNVTLNS
ncbi:MAG: hypothetical protein NUW37_10175 [Planctomycetes bacterium]|nr:hypothetical protein [Planctomycetota bacterium]